MHTESDINISLEPLEEGKRGWIVWRGFPYTEVRSEYKLKGTFFLEEACLVIQPNPERRLPRFTFSYSPSFLKEKGKSNRKTSNITVELRELCKLSPSRWRYYACFLNFKEKALRWWYWVTFSPDSLQNWDFGPFSSPIQLHSLLFSFYVNISSTPLLAFLAPSISSYYFRERKIRKFIRIYTWIHFNRIEKMQRFISFFSTLHLLRIFWIPANCREKGERSS